jgi:hypothetical protein
MSRPRRDKEVVGLGQRERQGCPPCPLGDFGAERAGEVVSGQWSKRTDGRASRTAGAELRRAYGGRRSACGVSPSEPTGDTPRRAAPHVGRPECFPLQRTGPPRRAKETRFSDLEVWDDMPVGQTFLSARDCPGAAAPSRIRADRNVYPTFRGRGTLRRNAGIDRRIPFPIDTAGLFSTAIERSRSAPCRP